MAEASRLGIPIVFSTDPRHGVGRGGPGGAAPGAPAAPPRPTISQWPDQLGLAVARDPEQVRHVRADRGQRAAGHRHPVPPRADGRHDHRASLESDRQHVRRGSRPGHVAHEGDRRGFPGQAARARKRDDRHQALPRRRTGEGRLRWPQRLREVVHLPRQPVRPSPAVLQGRDRSRHGRHHDRLRHPGRQGHGRDRVLEGDGQRTAPAQDGLPGPGGHRLEPQHAVGRREALGEGPAEDDGPGRRRPVRRQQRPQRDPGERQGRQPPDGR